MPILVQISLVLFGLGLLAWPVVHAVLLWEGMKVLGARGAALGPVCAAVVLTPLAVVATQLGVSCAGNLTGFAPLAIGASGLAVLIGVGVRGLAYRAILDLPGRAAFGLAIGVSVLSWVYGSVMAAIAVFGVWAQLATGS